MSKAFSTGESSAKREAARASAATAQQKQKEQAALAEEEDEIARRKSLVGKKGQSRRSLIRTSETGVSGRSTLG